MKGTIIKALKIYQTTRELDDGISKRLITEQVEYRVAIERDDFFAYQVTHHLCKVFCEI